LPIVGLVGGRDFTNLNWPAFADACAVLRNNEQIGDADWKQWPMRLKPEFGLEARKR